MGSLTHKFSILENWRVLCTRVTMCQ